MPHQLLLVVETTLHLPGLGLLVMSSPHEAGLRRFPLHANLEVEVRLAEGPLTVPASVEELQRGLDGERPEYVLLLESDAVPELPTGTEIWLSEEWAGIYGV
ncbi:hypothetical protein F0P96_15995 [Hymenobacter busanensis]|uniref:Uncharacterized protein n=1 Tax=Hymenobacter busanensis TaxID=2607656 RepID=A0A7L4ZS99_9BACT|nr:hypothetical protein [Hymenobacter busanensis]KAA9327483.1 hypothetical protein F0P96_15995 [Hymenobacter busanensis]QHJ06179.1 hypothetical protein GUY19_02240 [Hymenobacter busanensis]